MESARDLMVTAPSQQTIRRRSTRPGYVAKINPTRIVKTVEVVSAAMPTYDYSCRSCGARFEAWQKMTDDPITVCPTCGGDVHRVIYPVGLVFKGSGFYITDNHSSSANGNGHHAGASGDTQTDTPSAAASDSSTSAGASTGSEASSGAKAETTSKSAASATPASAGGAKE